jgi:O-antigen/teichoic acid export membrane protein
MSLIKKLAGQTAIYGLSSIFGRLLNYLLVPMYTRVFDPEQYGVVTQYYAFSGFLLVLLSYRMESAFFRFGTDGATRESAYSTCIKLIFITLGVVFGIFLPFVPFLSDWLNQPNHHEYLYLFAGILATDVLCELPFARLRLENRPTRFATIKLINIALNIGCNLFFLVLCPYLLKSGYSAIEKIYNPSWAVLYVFLSNLIAGMVTFLMLSPQWLHIKNPIDWSLARRILPYSLPLVIVSLAGVIDEMLSRVIMPKLMIGTEIENTSQLGIYGANYKVAVLISLFTQAYRYAAEPFFFKHAKDGNDGLQLQADSTKWFTIVLCGAMLALMISLDIVQLMVGPEFRVGIGVVPILLIANVLLGVYYNFSIWFRLRDRTMTGARISVIGACITVAALYLLVPPYGYYGAAWSTLICYAYMVLATWYSGRAHYPAPYQLGRMCFYFGLSIGLYFLFMFAFGRSLSTTILWTLRLCCLAIYAGAVWRLELSKKAD